MVYKCIICGFAEDEVDKLYSFPRNLEKSKRWHEAMGMVFTGESFRHRKICSRHFTPDSYKNASFELNSDAVPRLFPCAIANPVLPVPVTPINLIEQTEDISNASPSKTGLVHQDDLSAMIMKPTTSKILHSELLVQPNIPTSVTALCRTPPPKRQRSLYKNIEGLSAQQITPRKQALIRTIKRKEDYIRKLKKVSKIRARKFKSLCDIDSSPLVKNLFKNMPSQTTNFLISQLRCANRSPKGRRWTIDEKVMALALYKRSPKCFNLLRKFVALPARRTLTNLLEKVPFNTGVNEHLFKHIDDCLCSNKDEDRICFISFDEMDIKANLQYDAAVDRIRGYEDQGRGQTTCKIAKKALVFMAQGLRRNWKQPLAYYFLSSNCSAELLQILLVEVLDASINIAKLNVVATVCDMGTNNVKLLKNMNSSVAQPYILHEGKKIFTVFDPPHLLKCTAALFRKYVIDVPVEVASAEVIMEAKFEDVLDAYKIDQTSPFIFRSMHKLKETHLAPKMRTAMKVKIAAQLLSRTVAAFIYSLISRGVSQQRAIATATFIQQADELFDSFNGNTRTAPDGKEVRCWITEDSPHKLYWKKAFGLVNRWHFHRITKTGQRMRGKPPSQVGWLTSIRAIQGIWQYVRNYLSYLKPRSLNQDSLENLFGCIRLGCGCNENPTVTQFIASIKTQIINGLVKNDLQGTNCEEDDNVLLTNLKSFLDIKDYESEVDAPLGACSQTAASNVERVANDVAAAVSVGNVQILSVAYVSGFIANRILKEINNCDGCFKELTTDMELSCNQFIMYKEYSDKQKLTYPSENLVIAVGVGITELEKLWCESFACDIEKRTMSHLKKSIDFSWIYCSIHRLLIEESVIKGVCRIGIPWLCKRENQKLKLQSEHRAAQRKLNKLRNE